MNTFSHVPPGFRFHPTDEELVDYYLRKKVASKRIDLDVIKDVDLYKIEPWDLQELCRIGTEEQNDWYFFSHKDKKYPTGTRTNRATKAGFWKATGRDKAIYSRHSLIGMRKTLVFYKGRAPNGQKVFKKRMPTMRKVGEYDSPCWYDEQAVDPVTDWRVLDKFVASQLSHDDASKEANYSNAAAFHVAEQMNMLASESKRPEIVQEYASTSTSSCQIDLWK
ncbi:hypothetical protein GH714_029762 [Hevea brasiliensis]|uniref:NAC domain-containing protein n=1 Tax=Hevea brasiliensis TaxID=3981 RepID=A0A6A6LC78_HEVBR|nr:hypothetical protein GH714_029762 [Hevea brasiliensis]